MGWCRLDAAVLGCMAAVALGAGCGAPAASTPAGTASAVVATPTTSRARTSCAPTGSEAPDKAVTGYLTAVGAHDAQAACRYLAPEYVAQFDSRADPTAFDAWVANYVSLTLRGPLSSPVTTPGPDAALPGYRDLHEYAVTYRAQLRTPVANETSGVMTRFVIVGRRTAQGPWLVLLIGTGP
jgi:hypothetical protein